MTELKPCPFCGGVAFVDRFMRPKEEWRVLCTACTARIGRYAGFTKKEAIKKWNNRHVPKSELEFDYEAEDS